MTAPRVTVVTATWGRGRHVLPTLRSALAQTMPDLELLVVGDGCADETEAAVASLGDARVRWLNLDRNHGSQSWPNNAGIAAARAPFVAYLGHDDLWAPDHLARALALAAADPELDVAVAGCALHAPPGVGWTWVTGLFDEEGAALRHFFPPSSVAHRRDLTDRVGPWRDPAGLADPVDVDLQLRAARAGLRYASTGRVTVHKFASTLRYLSYLGPSSDEQEAWLARMGRPGWDAEVEAAVGAARAEGRFMTHRIDGEAQAPGEVAARVRRLRGLGGTGVRPLDGPARLDQDDAPRALDWRPFEPGESRVRLRHRTLAPRLLVPFTGDGPALLRVEVTAPRAATLRALRLASDGADLPARLGPTPVVGRWPEGSLAALLPLRPDGPLALTFRLADGPPDAVFGVGALRLDPVPPGTGLDAALRAAGEAPVPAGGA